MKIPQLLLAGCALISWTALNASAEGFDQGIQSGDILKIVKQTKMEAKNDTKQIQPGLVASRQQPLADAPNSGKLLKTGFYEGCSGDGPCWIRISKVEPHFQSPAGSEFVLVTAVVNYREGMRFVMESFGKTCTKVSGGYGDESWNVSLTLYSSQEGIPQQFKFSVGGDQNGESLERQCDLSGEYGHPDCKGGSLYPDPDNADDDAPFRSGRPREYGHPGWGGGDSYPQPYWDRDWGTYVDPNRGAY